jgi:hypothetical protein
LYEKATRLDTCGRLLLAMRTARKELQQRATSVQAYKLCFGV